MFNFAWHRLWAVISKEFIQMMRDRGTFAMIVAIPIMQVILFGYAINNDPKHLPTAVLSADNSNFTRTFIQGMKNSQYFKFVRNANSEAEAEKLLATNQVQFVLNIPPNFSHDLVRGLQPQLLLEADATDPAATGNAIAAVNTLAQTVFKYDFQGALNYLVASPNANDTRVRARRNSAAITQYNIIPGIAPIDLRIHAKYNPAANTQYNIVPGLMGVVITMTMVMITAGAITRERERGTMENLLATPVRPIEVIIGKVLPYIIVGYLQAFIILIIAFLLFNVPVLGSLTLLLLTIMPFIAANLAVGLLLSTAAKNQLQAVQMSIFFFLPSLLLSGFMFPFRGMPDWAQWIGNLLPMTHFLRIVRGIMLKGNGWVEVWTDLWPILVFLLVIVLLGIKRFHRTLD